MSARSQKQTDIVQSIVVSFLEGFLQIRIRTEIQWALVLLVFMIEIGAVGEKEQGQTGTTLVVRGYEQLKGGVFGVCAGSEVAVHFARLLYVLQLTDLGEGVMAQRLVQWSVAIFVGHIHVTPFADEQLQAWTLVSLA